MMRILFVSLSFPRDSGAIHGVFRRLDLLVGGLVRMGELEFLFFVDEDVDVSEGAVAEHRRRLSSRWGTEIGLRLVRREPPASRPSRWEAYGAPVFDAFRQPGFRRASGPRQREALESALDRRPDLLFAHRLAAMAPILRTDRQLPPIVFDLDDVEHRSFARDIAQPPVWPGKYLRYLQVPAVWRAERRAISSAMRTFVCSPSDRDYLAGTMRVDGLMVIPNAVEMPAPVALPSAPAALFLGSLAYAPNRNAAVHLMREIWPRVRREIPDAELTIAGPDPQTVPGHDDPPPGVRLSGFVEDLSGLYARTRVVCTPIFSGGGTRIKIIEAGAFGRPVVSTTLGAEGLDLADGCEIVLRDDPDGFATAVVELMRDDARAARIGAAARSAIERTYERTRVVERIRREVAECLTAGESQGDPGAELESYHT